MAVLYSSSSSEVITPITGLITQVNGQKTASSFATDSYGFWGAESRKNSQNVPSRHVFLQNLISYLAHMRKIQIIIFSRLQFIFLAQNRGCNG